MGLRKRHCLKLIFIKESTGIFSLLNCPNKVKLWTVLFKKGCSTGVYPQGMWCNRFHEVRKKLLERVRPLFFKFLLLTAATNSPEYLRIRIKLWIWNQSNSHVDNYQCLHVQTMSYLDKPRKDRLACFCWKKSWNRDCCFYSQMLFPGSHCCFHRNMNVAIF